jgi:hypothetical protein
MSGWNFRLLQRLKQVIYFIEFARSEPAGLTKMLNWDDRVVDQVELFPFGSPRRNKLAFFQRPDMGSEIPSAL